MKTNHRNGEKFKKRINRSRKTTKELKLRSSSWKDYKREENQKFRNKIKSAIRNGNYDNVQAWKKTLNWELC